MIPSPSADYTAQEAKLLGGKLAVLATLLPYYWPNGVNGDGTFTHCSYVAPDRIQADEGGFSGGEWISEVLTSNLQVSVSSAAFNWGWNYPGFDVLLYWRAADNTTDLAAESWTLVNQGDILVIKSYYQFRATIEGYRCRTVNAVGDADAFTAYAVDDASKAGNASYLSYAVSAHIAGDNNCYIEDLELLGEFTIVSDIEQAGTVTQEAPRDFSDLVAGAHDGLVLNNRQGSYTWDGFNIETLVFTPAPLYSPNKSSFLFANEPGWYGDGSAGSGKKLRIDLAWELGGFLEAPFLSTPFLWRNYTDPITLFLGKVDEWGPVNRAVDADGAQSPNTVEIRAKDFILDCLEKRLCLPAADGTPQPFTYGEYLCKADSVSGWSPAPVLRSAYFESNNYNELDYAISIGGGDFSLITPGITGDYAFRASVTGANQSAYGGIRLPSDQEMFITGSLRFTSIPDTISNLNMTFLEIIDSSGSADFALSVDSSGAIYSGIGGGEQSKFNVLGYEDVPLFFAMWLSPTNPGFAYLWIMGDEVLAYKANLSGDSPIEFRFGADTAGVAETWTIDFDDIEVRNKYYKDAFRVTGGPFTDIGAVYIDNISQPDSQTVGAYTQTLTRYPAYGIVQFTSTDPEFSLTGEVLMRVIENAGGRHALCCIEDILDQVGLTAYVDATALAAAYVSCPDDLIHARFEGGDNERFGLKDYANLGIPAGDCLKEICSRMMYWLFIEAGSIKIIPYTGTAPGSAAMAFTASNMHEASQTFALGGEDISSYVTAIYGWYERNPSLFYIAGAPAAGGQGTGLDYSWESPVVCESRAVVKAKTDLLYKFLSAKERIDPVRTKRFQAARLELMQDAVSIADEVLNDAATAYHLLRKEITLDIPREVALTPIRFLGEN